LLAVRTLAGLLSMAACATGSAGRDVPAVLTTPTAESRAELLRVVSRALNRVPLALAEDALTHDSALIIERARARDPEGARLDGRETGRPERFRLVKNGSRCVLVHERTGKRFRLASAACAPK